MKIEQWSQKLAYDAVLPSDRCPKCGEYKPGYVTDYHIMTCKGAVRA